jgi:hypothetical protein
MFTIGDVSIVEGNAGTTNALVQVNVTEPHGNSVSVKYSTVSGSALAGSDFNAVTNTLVFTKNQMSKTVLIPIRGDRVAESTESFTVQLSNAKGAKIADGVANVSISDDEPWITVDGWSAIEGNEGTQEYTFNVSLSSAYDQTVTVDFNTSNGSALADSDYVAKNTTVTFAQGQPTSQPVTVVVNGDQFVESDEYFVVNLSNASSNAKISNGVGYGTIYDDEPWITVENGYITEGDDGTQELTFNVTLSGAYDQLVSFDYVTSDGSAESDSDYVGTNGTVTFIPGEPITQTIKVVVNGDEDAEYDEYFQVNLSNVSSNAQINTDVVYGTIYDDEPRITIYDTWFYYDSIYMVFTVTLSEAPTDEPVTVDFQTWDGWAVAGYDYEATFGTLTFDVGETTEYIYVPILNFNNTDIYFHVQLSNASAPVLLANEWATGYWYYDYGYYWYDPGYYDPYYGWY